MKQLWTPSKGRGGSRKSDPTRNTSPTPAKAATPSPKVDTAPVEPPFTDLATLATYDLSLRRTLSEELKGPANALAKQVTDHFLSNEKELPVFPSMAAQI